MTADGSINCANCPDEQESIVGQLIFCEAVAALNLLCQGGNFVFKMFTAFEHRMVSLMYLLACVFQEIQVIKPGTSKSGNSEVYIVCLQFIGKQQIPSCILDELKKDYTLNCPSTSLFSLQSIPAIFLERLKTCQTYFTELQMKAIDQNIRQFHYMTSAERKVHNQLRQLVVEHFVERFHLQPISEEEHIVMGTRLDGTQLSFTRGSTNYVPFVETFTGRHQMGSYNQRQGSLHQNWLDKIKVDHQLKFCPSHSRSLKDLSQVSNGVPLIPLYHDQVIWLPRTKSISPESWKPRTAARLLAILNSRFCTPIYISKLQEAHQQAAILREENADNLRALLDKVNPSNIVKMSSGGEAELRNLDNLVFFSEMAKGENYGIVLNLVNGLDFLVQYLQEKNARFHSIQLHNGTPLETVNDETICKSQRVNIVFANLSHTDELSSKREIVYLCIVALRLLGSGGTFVLNIHQTLTRFSVGILFIMHQMFDKVAMVKPVMSHLFRSQRFLVCKGFLSDVQHYVTYLAQVFDQLSNLEQEKSAFDVVEIVPMHFLYSEQFYSFVKRTNEQLAHLQLKEIVQLENLFLNPDQLPSSEEISNLEKEVTAYLK